jgi:hypothetical protein
MVGEIIAECRYIFMSFVSVTKHTHIYIYIYIYMDVPSSCSSAFNVPQISEVSGLTLYGVFLLMQSYIHTFRRTAWTGDQPIAWPLPTQDNTDRTNRPICSLEWDSNKRQH